QWEVSAGQGRQDVDETGPRSRSYEVMPGRPTLHTGTGQTDQAKGRPALGAASQTEGHTPRRLFQVSTSEESQTLASQFGPAGRDVARITRLRRQVHLVCLDRA